MRDETWPHALWWLVCAAVIIAMAVGIAARRRRPPIDDGRTPTWTQHAAVVVNPTKLPDPAAYQCWLRGVMATAGWIDPLWLETSLADPGRGQAAAAVRAGVDVVFACGGDGTITACASALADTGIPLAVVPLGTGNLFARNLNLPLDASEAVRIGLTGVNRPIDVGVAGGRRFLVMAGIGLDAAMVADAPERLKKRLGWAAYVVSVLRHARDRQMRVTLRLDEQPPLRRRARMVLVGNVGALQGGVQLLPDARPDDGLLDVVVFAPRRTRDWVRVGFRVITRRSRGDQHIAHFQARHVEIQTDRPEPRQLDGDLIGMGTSLDITIDPGALLVRTPRPPDWLKGPFTQSYCVKGPFNQ